MNKKVITLISISALLSSSCLGQLITLSTFTDGNGGYTYSMDRNSVSGLPSTWGFVSGGGADVFIYAYQVQTVTAPTDWTFSLSPLGDGELIEFFYQGASPNFAVGSSPLSFGFTSSYTSQVAPFPDNSIPAFLGGIVVGNILDYPALTESGTVGYSTFEYTDTVIGEIPEPATNMLLLFGIGFVLVVVYRNHPNTKGSNNSLHASHLRKATAGRQRSDDS